MKMTNKVEKVLIIVLFFLVIIFPYAMKLLGVNSNLDGSEEKVKLSLDNLDEYFIQNFPGREYIIKTKNQLLYTMFDISPNDAVTKIGDTLISTETIDYFVHGEHSVTDEYIETFTSKLKEFNKFCIDNNKIVVVILTPTKLRYYDGNLPVADEIIMQYSKDNSSFKNKERGYDKLKRALVNANINCFDCIEYIDNNKEEILNTEPPLFYKSGHHWGNYKGNLVGLGLHEYMRNKFGFKIPGISLKASPSDTAIYPDSDLFNVLNVYEKPNEKFYESVVKIEVPEIDNRNYIVQGGSFLGGLLIPYMTISPEGSVVHISNKDMFIDNFKTYISFDNWDDANRKYTLLDKCKNADVFIFEINELNVYNATFGFLDYLLMHKGEL